ncbi:armadillo-type protein [Pyronema domesticum]|uniref:ARM repeat-containing protein n=1 Tax=Pyronema omphalodes (strain CBS 100304) TaxID=1076935 RepID=U4LUV3_PYROM|nr:armadillo-type protein [Pyronema domesticum]CCX31971.1 Similar to hypothetical protein [Tuber melanosporum Mel28]; acc. no. XP_002839036 [Pyronema omphalodes CBS 100304]
MTTDAAIEVVENTFKTSEKNAETLSPVLTALKELQESNDEKALNTASKAVWHASREEPWRIPIGEAGILEFFQSLIETVSDESLKLNCLRIMGNACAEKDANRKRVLEHPLSIGPIVSAIVDSSTRVIAAVVLGNICTEYEPAQLAAVEKGACQTIFNVLSDEEFDDDLDYFLRVLELLLSHDTGKEATPESALPTLLEFLEIRDEGFDNTLSLVSILSSLLTTSRFQNLTLKKRPNGEPEFFPRILDLLERTYQVTVDAEREAKDKSLVAYARNQIVESIGEIASLPEFQETYPLDGPLMNRIRAFLEPQPGKEELVVAACLAYGNVGRSHPVCMKLVDLKLQEPLLKIILQTVDKFEASVKAARKPKIEDVTEQEDAKEEVDPDEPTVEKLPTGAMSVGIIHAAVGVLKNLAIPPENKARLASSGVFAAIRRILQMEGVGVGQVWYSAVSLGRLCVVNTTENVITLLSPGSVESPETLLELFLKRYQEVEELPVQVEISRTLAACLRTIYAAEDPKQEILDMFMSHDEKLEGALWDMVKQDKYPVVASEGWFAMALFTRSQEGAERAVKVLDEEVVRNVLTEGQLKKDKDNVGVMLVGLRQAGENKTVEELLSLFVKQAEEVKE